MSNNVDELELALLDDSQNTSIALSVKRKRLSEARKKKKFNSQLFFDKVVSNIEAKYKDDDSFEIDLEDFSIHSKENENVKKIKCVKFGDFSNGLRNTLNECFVVPEIDDANNDNSNNNALVPFSTSIVKSDDSIIGKSQKMEQNTKSNPIEASLFSEPVCTSIVKVTNTNSYQKSLCKLTKNISAKRSLFQNCSTDEDMDAVVANMIASKNRPYSTFSSELEFKKQKRSHWIDLENQKHHLRETIDSLIDNTNQRLLQCLYQNAVETMQSSLQTIDFFPILRFDINLCPKFEFYFLSSGSPNTIYERLNHVDAEIIELSKWIYEFLLEQQDKQ